MNSTERTFGIGVERARELRDLGLGGRLGHVDVHEHAPADLVRRARGGLDDRDEDPEHEGREQHGEDRGEARRGVAPQRPERLAEEEADAHLWTLVRVALDAHAELPAQRGWRTPWWTRPGRYMPERWSRMMRPSRSSTTRRRILSTISLSCVATTTVVPVRLMR